MIKPAVVSSKYVNLYYCPVCYGHGERPDQKTQVLRRCVACGGTGWIRKRTKH